MRRTIYIAPHGPARCISADSLEPVDHGQAPRWRASDASDQALKIRLPRRLSMRRLAAGDDVRWVRGQSPAKRPSNDDGYPAFMHLPIGSVQREWERAYPRCGLGLPKRLPRPSSKPYVGHHDPPRLPNHHHGPARARGS